MGNIQSFQLVYCYDPIATEFVFLFSVPSVCQFVHIIDGKASAPARVPLNVTNLS